MISKSDYIAQEQTKLFERLGVFFAFSDEQFHRKAIKAVAYASCGAGMVVPKVNVNELSGSLAAIHQEGMKSDRETNSNAAIIRRELFNYECFYTGDISDAVDSLAAYDISHDEIFNVYNETLRTEGDDIL